MPAPQTNKVSNPSLVITKVIKKDPDAVSTLTQPKSPPQPNLKKSTPAKELAAPSEDAMFQAVGIISGVVSIIPASKQPRALITIDEKQYPLGYAPAYKRVYKYILNKSRKNPNLEQQLIVYPCVLHCPGKPHQLSFNVVGYVAASDKPNTLQQVLNKNEFILRGLWQIIPVCKMPVVSIHKNLTDERKAYMKEASLEEKVAFAKAIHLPLLWKDPMCPAFRFNPKLNKEQQGQAGFVNVKVTLDPARDCFVFESMLGMPTLPPPFIKAAKADRLEVNKAKAKARRNRAG